MTEHRAYVRKYLAEERNKKPVLPSNKSTCPSNSSNATRTSLNGFSNGFVGSEFEYKFVLLKSCLYSVLLQSAVYKILTNV